MKPRIIFHIACALASILPLQAQQSLKWEILGNMITSRVYPAVAVAHDTLGFIVGGYSGGLFSTPTPRCEVVALTRDGIEQRQIARMVHGRAEFPLLVENDTALIAISGFDSTDGVTRTVERYSIRSNRWAVIGTLLEGRRQHSATWISGHEILVIGGRQANLQTFSDAEIFDVRSGLTRKVRSFPKVVNGSVAQRVDHDLAIYFGGREGSENSPRSPDIYWYDVAADQWRLYAQMPSGREVPMALTLQSGVTAIVGGSEAESPARFIGQVLAVSNGTCTLVANLPFGIVYGAAFEFRRDEVIVAGGWLSSLASNRRAAAVHLPTGVVRDIPSLNFARRYTRGFSLRRRVQGGSMVAGFVIGGIGGNDPLQTIEYLFDTDCLSRKPSASELAFNGDAKPEGSNTKLTGTKTFSAGSVWKPFVGSPTRDGFHHRIKARLANGDNRGENEQTSPGADGIVLVVQRHGVDALGASGRNIGYSGIRNGVAIEFDTYVNLTNADPPGHHLAVMKPVNHSLSAVHNEASTAAFTLNVPNIVSDSSPFYIDYHYLNRKLTVTVSKTNDFDNASLIVENFDIDALIGLNPGEPYFIGFTSATGVAVQEHIIDDWMEFSCMEPSKATSVNEPAAGYPITARSTPTLAITPSPASVFADVFLPVGQGAPTTLAVFDVQGREVLRMNLEGFTEVVQIPVANLAAGMYVVHVVTTTTTATGLLPVSR
jgi:hypothetical protein